MESRNEEHINWQYGIRLNAGHTIFKGHFPGNPIVPGVCQIQMVTEILEEHYKKPLFLKQVANIKFLAVLKPEETERIVITFKKIQKREEELLVSVTLSDETRQFSKIKLVYGYGRT